MKLVLDAGAIIALDRGDRSMWLRLEVASSEGRAVVTSGAVVGQAWRGGGARQARLARALATFRVVAVDEALGKDAGRLLARSRTSDVVDASLVLLAGDGDIVVTSDPADLALLAEALDVEVRIVPV